MLNWLLSTICFIVLCFVILLLPSSLRTEQSKNTTIIRLKVTNCYLIKVHDYYVLIDTGYHYEWELFLKQLSEFKINISDIKYVILTHHHDDHCGLLNNLVIANENIKVVASCFAKEFLATGKHIHTPGGGYPTRRVYVALWFKKLFDKEWTHTFPVYRFRKNDISIEKDTLLRDIGIELDGKIITTPGHSKDSISVVLDDGRCFLGDAAANFLQFLGTKYSPISIDDIELYYRSWQKIIDLKSTFIFPAHGKPFSSAELINNMGKIKKEHMIVMF